MYGYTLSKKITNSSGDAPSPYFTPILAKNSKNSSISTPLILPLELTYMLRINNTRSWGSFRHSIRTYHNFSLFMLSYALCKSMNARHRGFFVMTLCWISVCRISACSIVPWCSRKPAYVGACRSNLVACAVSLLFITAMYSFANGGVIAMLL